MRTKVGIVERDVPKADGNLFRGTARSCSMMLLILVTVSGVRTMALFTCFFLAVYGLTEPEFAWYPRKEGQLTSDVAFEILVRNIAKKVVKRSRRAKFRIGEKKRRNRLFSS